VSHLIESEGLVVLLDADRNEITTPQPCKFAWSEERGRFACHMRTEHRIALPEGGAMAVAIIDHDGRLLYAHRLLGEIRTSGELVIEADPG